MSAITSSRPTRRRADRIALSDPTMIAAAALTVAALLLRLSQIDQSLYGDELFTYTDILGRSARGVLTNVHTGGENSPPLFFLFAWATAKLGNPTELIRLPSIVLGAATIPVVYLIGRETVGRWAGVLAGAVVTASPFSLYYGVEARPYAAMAFFVAVSTWALLRAVRGAGGWWVLYALAAAAAAYCHYTCIFVLIVQGAWSLWACRDRIWLPLGAAIVAVILYIPWIGKLRGKELAVIGFLEPLTAHNVAIDLMRPIAGYPYAPLSAIPTWVGLGLIVAAAVGGFCALAWRARPAGVGSAPSWPEHFWLLFALALATPLGMLLYSETATDLWLARGLYASMPAAALLLAALLLAIPRPANAAAVVVVLGVLVVGTVRAASPSWRRPPTRAVAGYVDRIAAPRDPVTVSNQLVGQPLYNQVNSRHRFTDPGHLWAQTPRGGRAVLAVGNPTSTGPSRAPHPPSGFRLLARRRFFSAIMPITVWVYQRAG